MAEGESESGLTVKIHLQASFRNDQEEGDDFELYLGQAGRPGSFDDPFWLNEEEMVKLRDTIDEMLAAHRAATEALRGS